ncbi:hypothetical protein [Streptomyces sp. NPDC001068]|uniref:hypothetical protein n=1 Tax=Streptomyces sp. NPDC001068 TaxID=3364544 RepID=UPI0036A51B0B
MSLPPPHAAPYAPFTLPVTLSATVTVNGVEIGAQECVDPHAWAAMSTDPAAVAAYERLVWERLGRAIVEHLAPAVTVGVPAAPVRAERQTPDVPSEA